MKTRAYNFGAGPAMLPESILLKAQAELLNWQNTGVSILEVGHRTEAYQALMSEAEAELRALITIPANYHVLFLGGAARTQFATVPMNLIHQGEQAAYLISGIWSQMAYQEACKISKAYCAGSSESHGFISTPPQADLILHDNTSYLFYTPNETVNGVRFSYTPHAESIPLVADMTSCLLSEPICINDFGLIFAGAQKNISAAGLTVVIIRDDLLKQSARNVIPTMFDYQTHATYHSLYATPPTFNCYLAAKMFRWVKEQGGVDALYSENCKKAAKLYEYIDSSSFYTCNIEKNSRSIVNVCFSIKKQALENEFVERASQRGLLALRGHRYVGGLRASLYNAMPMDGVLALIEFMHEFAKGYRS